MSLSVKEKELVSYFLQQAADEFTNHGCNDLPDKVRKILTKQEWAKLIDDYHVWNNSPEDERDGKFQPHMMVDWLWMQYFADKILND